MNKPQQSAQQSAGMTVSSDALNRAKDIVCEHCAKLAFVPAFILKEINPLLSPTGKRELVPIQVFACASCGHVNTSFLPKSK